jgi:transposase-like protein
MLEQGMPSKSHSTVTLATFKSRFDTDEKCRTHLERITWGDTPACRHCGSLAVSRIRGKSARPGLLQCNERLCGKQFTVTVGTVFQDTHLPLTKWFLAIYLIAESSKGISANSLSKWLGTTYRTAWHLGHRIRRLMGAERTLLTGIVELDETYVGGKPRRGDPPAKRGRGTKKFPVFVAVARGGEVRATTMDDLKFDSMKPHLDAWVAGDAKLMTDEFKAYDKLGKFWKWHFRVTHSTGEFERDGAHTNNAESFNSTLKRAHTGVFHYMSAKHLLRYVEEAVFRWNAQRGKVGTLDRVGRMIGNALNKPLPYKTLVAEAISAP